MVVEDRELVLALRDLVTAAERERLRMARETLGVGVNEIQACAFIAESGPRTPSELAERLQITTASVTELVDRLQRDDPVSRLPHPTDRRKLLVTLTPDGARKTARVHERLDTIMSRCTTDLTIAERGAVLNFLRNAAGFMNDTNATDVSS
jgi:DNA-binding MarR family transcriptional regulator